MQLNLAYTPIEGAWDLGLYPGELRITGGKVTIGSDCEVVGSFSPGTDYVPSAGSISADVAGRAMIADDFFTTTEMVAGLGGKFAPGCFDETGCTNVFANAAIPTAKLKRDVVGGALITADATGRALIADDTFTTAEFVSGAGGKFAAGCLDTTALSNIIADDAITTAHTASGAGGKFAAGCFNEAGVTNAIADAAIPTAKLKRDTAGNNLLTADATGRALMADDFFTTAEFVSGAGGKFAPGCLDTTALSNVIADDAITTAHTASGAGGKFAAGCFDEAGVTNAIANAAIPTAKLKRDTAGNNLLTADATGRGLMADDFFTTAEFVSGAGGKFAAGCLDETACTNVFASGALPGDKIKDATVTVGKIEVGLALDKTIADPGDSAKAIAVTYNNGVCTMTAGAGAETRTVADPWWSGQTLTLTLGTAGGGTITVAFASAVNQAGNNRVAFTQAADTAIFRSVNIGGSYFWRIIYDNLTVLSTV